VPIDDVEEVSNYVAAMQHGLRRISGGFPLSLSLIREIHAILLRGALLSRTLGLFVFLLCFGPSTLCGLPSKLFSLLCGESCHAFLTAFAAGCFTTFSAHLSHDFGNKVASHSSIL